MKALEALCKESNQVAYWSGLEPLNGKCICGKPINGYVSFFFSLYAIFANLLASVLTADGYTSIVVILDASPD
jgi:hypothetical protein